ncbi:MAG: septum formation family protein [Nocardioides sp.]|nr:septum formation family protein [Nocardioides sp.]
MHLSARPWPALAVALCAALVTALVTALALVPAGEASARRAGPGYQQPTVGSCHSYSAQQLAKPTEGRAEVPCTGPHTAQTIAVLRVTGSPAATNAFTRYGPRCYRAMTKALGGNEAKIVSTAYAVAFFRPSNKQIEQGARWLRCDLVLAGGNRLQPLSSPLVTDPADDSVARCANGTASRATVCSRTHTYRVSGTVAGAGRYPSLSSFARIAATRCPAKVTTPKRFQLYFPPAEQWRSGAKAMACLSRTSR